MKQTTRELLVTTKVAQSWRDDFDSNVDGLMLIVSKVDTKAHVERVTELLDVYHNAIEETAAGAKKSGNEASRPFEFTVFRN